LFFLMKPVGLASTERLFASLRSDLPDAKERGHR
jgi:hypothetical protein